MGLDRIGAATFLSMSKRGIAMDSLLTLGRQHFAVSPLDIRRVPGLPEIITANPQLAREGERYAEPFFSAVGVGGIDSMDVSAYESCSLVHDLNHPIPADWHGRYDVVFDGGTLEHVFHFPNAVANAMNLVKQGGVLVTQSPSNNFNGHGFYQFSPELMFRVFCEANGFRVLLMALAESEGRRRIFRVDDPDRIGRRITFGGDSGLQMVMVATRERMTPPLETTPYQSDYSATWNDSQTGIGSQGVKPDYTEPASVRKKLRRMLPSQWIHRYDHIRNARKHSNRSMDGVTRVGSVDECWLR